MKSLWIISLFINVSDILFSILSNLVLANNNFLGFFCIFRVIYNNFFTIPVEFKNARLTFTLGIPEGAPITAANDSIEMLPAVTDKTIRYLSK